MTDAKSTHIPYRDSKLTRVLQDSLGGNSKTALIITCSPSLYNENETISTLRFGIRAKAIKNKPKINREYTIAELKLLLSKAQEELKLKERRLHILERSLKQNGITVSVDNALMSSEPTEEQNQELRQDLEETKALLTSIRERVRELEKESNEKEDNIQGMEVIMLGYDSKFKEMQADLISSRKKVDSLSEEVMRLISSKDTLQHEITTLRQQKINLEQLLNEKDVEIEQLKLADKLKNERPSELNRLHAQLNESQQHLTYQIDMNARLTQQIEDLNNQLNSYLSQEFHDIDKIKQNIREEILKSEQARWDVEKDMIFRDLKNRVDKVVRLEIELDDLKERYCRMERSMNSGERGLRKKVETLERNLEHISQLYQTTCFERADHLSEKQHYIRKCESLTHEVVALKTQVDILNVQITQMKNHIDALTSENNSLKLSAKMNLANKMRKTIRGGTSFLLGTSFLAGDKSRNQSMFMLPEEISEAPLTDR